MKKYCKIVGNVVVQTQRSPEEDFIECPESVNCGMVKVGNEYQSPPPIIKTPAEIDAELDAKVDFANVDPFLKAFVLAVNDGSIVPGSNMSGAALKAAIKAKL